MKVNFDVAEEVRDEIKRITVEIDHLLIRIFKLSSEAKSQGWNDSKYDDYINHLNSIAVDMRKSLLILKEYAQYLDERIKLKY